MEEEKVDTSSRSVEEVKVESEEESNLKTSLTSLDTSLRSVEERISELEAIVDGMMDYLEEVEVEVEPSSLPEETATTVMSSGREEPEKVKESTLGGKDENDSEKPIKQGKRQPTIWG